jgi:hypothetical protein
MQQWYQTESGVDPLSKPSIYALYKQFYETGCLCTGKTVTFAAECTDGMGIPT